MPRLATAPIRLAVLGAATALGLAACGSGGPAVSQGDPAACPGQVLDVVVSVDQWGDLVRTLGGACATVTTVLTSTAVDPHDYEPSTGDIASFENADLVVVNGAGYDRWASSAVTNLDPQPRVVNAAQVMGIDGTAGANPHLWYSPDAVGRTAAAVTSALTDLDPGAAGYLAGRATEWTSSLQPYTDELAVVTGLAPGRTYAATESVFDGTAQAVGLTDATPAGYRDAASNDSDPSSGDVAAFEQALTGGGIDVLVVNTQTQGSIPDQLRAVAEDAGVPVVEVTESVPPGAESFLDWQLGQLQQLGTALGAAR